MPVTNIFRVRTFWTGLVGGDFLTTTNFDGNVFSPQVTSTKMDGFWTALAPRISNRGNYSMDSLVDEVDPTSGDIVAQHIVTPDTGQGASSSAPLSAGTQGLINLFTNVFINGRQLRGKLYVPGMVSTNLDEEIPSEAWNTAALAAYDTFNTGGIQPPVVYSPTHSRWEPVFAPQMSTRMARLDSRVR